MGLLSESKTDEEYVEVVRAWLAAPKRFRARHTGTLLLLLAMAAVLPVLAGKGFARFVAPEADYRIMDLLSTARMSGLPLSYAIYWMLWGVRARRGLRVDRLMIRYCDELKDEPRGAQETEENPTDERNGLARGLPKARVIRWLLRGDYPLRGRTDTECIASARRLLERLRRLSPVFFGAAVFFVVLFLAFLWLMKSDLSHLSEMKPWAGFAVGLVSGLLGGLMAWCAVDHFVEVLLGFRNPRPARLMLRYHDAWQAH